MHQIDVKTKAPNSRVNFVNFNFYRSFKFFSYFGCISRNFVTEEEYRAAFPKQYNAMDRRDKDEIVGLEAMEAFSFNKEVIDSIVPQPV